MVAWFLIAISTIAFFAYIAVSGVQTVDTTGTIAARADTVRRSDNIAEAILERSSNVLVDNVIYAPAGVSGNGEYLLPEDLQPAGSTTSGSRLQYCPMGAPLTAAATDTVTYPGGSYGIRTASAGGKSFVIEGRPAIAAASDPNIIAFIIAQQNPTAAKPGCGQITQSGTSFTAPNGIVRVVRRTTAAEQDAGITANGTNWYVSARGTGDGLTWSSPAPLSKALAAYRSSQGGSFRIRLAPGDYTVEGNPLDQGLTAISPKKAESSLIMIGQQGVNLNIGSVNVPGNVLLRDVTMPGSNITVDNGTVLTMERASVGAVVVNGGSQLVAQGGIGIKGSTVYSGALQFLNGSSGTVAGTMTISYAGTQASIIVDGGSRASFASAAVTMQPGDSTAAATQIDSMVQIRPNGLLTAMETTFIHNGPSGWTWRVYGKLATNTTTFLFNAYSWVGIQPWLGAEVSLVNVMMRGSRPPMYTLAGHNTAKLTASGNIYSSQRCWSRDDSSSVFRLSAAGIAGDNANVSPDEIWANMTGTPNAALVRLNASMRARNTERAELRGKIYHHNGPLNCVESGPVTWTSCSADGGQCNLPSDAATNARTYTVRFGAGSNWNYIVTRSNIPCDKNVFGDPAVGATKSCQYLL